MRRIAPRNVVARIATELDPKALPQLQDTPTLQALLDDVVKLGELITEAARNRVFVRRLLRCLEETPGPAQYAAFLQVGRQAAAGAGQSEAATTVVLEIDAPPLSATAQPASADSAKRQYLKKKSSGACTRCREKLASVGHAHCDDCLAKMREASRKRRARKKRQADRAAQNGVAH